MSNQFTAPAVASRADVLRRLELAIARRLDGRGSGEHTTLDLGPGSERAGARAYEPGDDARLIDWNLTARSAETYVRRTQDERSIDTWILADRSASLDFGTIGSEKRDVALAATAAFGLVHLGGGNRVGMVVAGTQRLVHRPLRQGRPAFMAALATVHDTPRQTQAPGTGADLVAACRWLNGAARLRSRVVVISDFLDDEGWTSELRRLAIRHDVIAVHVTDPRELEVPDVGIIAVVDAETGRQRYVQTGSKALREKYLAAAVARQQAIASGVRSSGAEYLHLSTDRDWLTDTVRFATRRRRIRPMRGIGVPLTTAAPSGALTTSRG